MTTIHTQPLTAEEFYEFCHRPENRDRLFELERGEIVEVNRPGERHGYVCTNVARILGNYTFQQGKGYVVGNDAGLIVERGPDTLYSSDVFLFDDVRSYSELQTRFVERIPTLVVEVLSPSDRLGKVMRRVDRFLNRGVPLVWIVDPEARNVTIYRPGQNPAVREQSEDLTGEDSLPDLRLQVSNLFALPGEVSS